MLRLDIPITKVDAARRLVYGVATAEVADRAGEICDYASTKPCYERWSKAISDSTDGRSLGNLRAMHGAVAAGKVTALSFNDEARQIEICAKVVDDAEWTKVAEGVYTGFSQGGTYARRWTDGSGATRYTADPHEISLVDLPCLAAARFEMVKADGSHEWRRFHLDKAGARNSTADQERIQAVHDTAVALGAACPDAAAQKGAGGVEQAAFDKAGLDKAGLDALAKLLDARFGALSNTLGKAVAELSARLKAVEEQPQSLPFAGAARPVAKGGRWHDGAALDRGLDADALLADPSLLSLLAIKLAQRQGR